MTQTENTQVGYGTTTTGVTATWTGAQPEPTAPPFAALDRLSNVGQRIDEVVGQLIGQLMPYCSLPPAVSALPQEPSAELPSGLEQRIDREIALLAEIALRAEELQSRLRL